MSAAAAVEVRKAQEALVAAENVADAAAQTLTALKEKIAAMRTAELRAADAEKVADRLETLVKEFPTLRRDPATTYDEFKSIIAEAGLTPYMDRVKAIQAEQRRAAMAHADYARAKDAFLDLVDRYDFNKELSAAQQKEMVALYKVIRKGNVTKEPTLAAMSSTHMSTRLIYGKAALPTPVFKRR